MEPTTTCPQAPKGATQHSAAARAAGAGSGGGGGTGLTKRARRSGGDEDGGKGGGSGNGMRVKVKDGSPVGARSRCTPRADVTAHPPSSRAKMKEEGRRQSSDNKRINLISYGARIHGKK